LDIKGPGGINDTDKLFLFRLLKNAWNNRNDSVPGGAWDDIEAVKHPKIHLASLTTFSAIRGLRIFTQP
jgi:hypothetical protein